MIAGEGDCHFMIAGDVCTRGCRFCAVDTAKNPPPLNSDEPDDLASAIEKMGIEHAVITVVNRDDLADGGASHYRECIMAVHDRCPEVGIELLLFRFRWKSRLPTNSFGGSSDSCVCTQCGMCPSP